MFSDLDTYNTINADTEQGATFLEYKRKYATASGNNHDLLAVSSSLGLDSIVEAVDGTDSISRYQSAMQKNLSANQAVFNTLLSQYSTAYNNYISNLMDSNNTSEEEAKLRVLNAELITMAQTIVTEMKSLETSDNTLRVSTEDTQKKLVERIRQLKNEKDKMNSFNKKYDDTDSIDGKLETSALSMNSIYYHYIVYFFVGITLIVFIFYMSMNPNADPMRGIFLLVGLFAVYIISRWVNK